MIATVRIAPIERWCPQNLADLKNFPAGVKLVGMAVEILTETMAIRGDCLVRNKPGDWKIWRLTEKSIDAIEQATGIRCDRDLMLCEHMLEMD